MGELWVGDLEVNDMAGLGQLVRERGSLVGIFDKPNR